MLTFGLQAVYLTLPDRAAAVAQLERFRSGIRDLLEGENISDEMVDDLDRALRNFIAAVR